MPNSENIFFFLNNHVFVQYVSGACLSVIKLIYIQKLGQNMPLVNSKRREKESYAKFQLQISNHLPTKL